MSFAAVAQLYEPSCREHAPPPPHILLDLAARMTRKLPLGTFELRSVRSSFSLRPLHQSWNPRCWKARASAQPPSSSHACRTASAFTTDTLSVHEKLAAVVGQYAGACMGTESSSSSHSRATQVSRLDRAEGG